VGDTEDGKDVPRTTKICRSSRAIKILQQSHQLTRQPAVEEGIVLPNNLPHLEVTINDYKMPLLLTSTTMQM